jgi:hypothetical protein
MTYEQILVDALNSIDGQLELTTQKGPFTVTPIYNQSEQGSVLCGVDASNLLNNSFLSLEVFYVAINFLKNQPDNLAKLGNPMEHYLGDTDLPLDSLEGHLAHKVYGKQVGDSVFRRQTPIKFILQWTGICELPSREGTIKLIN